MPSLRSIGGVALFALVAAACGARTSLVPRPDGSNDGGGGGAGGQGGAGGTGQSSVATSTSVSTSVSSTTTGAGGEPNDAEVISSVPGSFFESETSIAAAANGLVAAAWITIGADGAPAIAYSFSVDDGESWDAPFTIPPVEGRIASDPVLAVDKNGQFYLTWVGYKIDPSGTPTDMQIFVARADPSVPKFGPPVLVSDPASQAILDKPWIAVTETGAVVVTYARFDVAPPFLSSMVAARSFDSAQSFERHDVTSSDSLFSNLGFVCTGSGTLFVTYVGIDPAGAPSIFLRRSDDEAATFGPAVQVSTETDVAFQDPNCVVSGNDVWVSYGLTPEPATGRSQESARLYAIRLAHSVDGGKSFGLTVSVHDPSAGAFFLLPQLVREPEGALDLSYYAGQFDEDPKGSFRVARTIASDSFGPSESLFEPLTFLQSRTDPRWLGDYTGLFARDGKLYASFAINDTGVSHVGAAVRPLP